LLGEQGLGAFQPASILILNADEAQSPFNPEVTDVPEMAVCG
jgi:hypothetical protein